MKKLITLTIGILIASAGLAQDVHFSQFWENNVMNNPALTGMVPGNLKLNLNYRNQWASVASPYKTYGFNGEYRMSASRSTDIGVGMSVYKDVAGDLDFGTTNLQVAVSSIVSIDDFNKVSVGIRGGFLQKNISSANMMWGSQYQGGTYNPGLAPNESINYEPGMKGDVSAGISYMYASSERYMTSNDQFYAKVGVSYNHINNPKYEWTSVSTDTLYSNYIGTAEFMIGLGNSRLTLFPSALYMKQGPSKEIIVGSLIRYRLQDASKITGFVKGAFLSVGGHFRLGDAFIPTLLIEFDKYAVGMSYDVNTSTLRDASGMQGGMELVLRFQSPNPYLYKGSRSSFR